MERINQVTVTSRRAAQIHSEWFTFEVSLGASVDGLSVKEKEDYIKDLWKEAAKQVDAQIADAAQS